MSVYKIFIFHIQRLYGLRKNILLCTNEYVVKKIDWHKHILGIFYGVSLENTDLYFYPLFSGCYAPFLVNVLKQLSTDADTNGTTLRSQRT